MKSKTVISLVAGFCLLSTFCFFSCKKEKVEKPLAVATLTPTKADTSVTGSLQFFEEEDGRVTLKLDITVPKKRNSTVAVHLHEHGMCGNAGADAHGHWNPTGKAHGMWGSANFHAGDIGNIALDANGRGVLELTTDLWTLSGNAPTNIVGKGVIVHSGVDDYTSQPAGNSGPRIGCGVVEWKK